MELYCPLESSMYISRLICGISPKDILACYQLKEWNGLNKKCFFYDKLYFFLIISFSLV